MELRHLRYFAAVAENGGLDVRAEFSMFLSRQSASEYMTLKRKLGVELFRRHPHRISLTQQGEQFLKDSKEILSLADRAVANVKRAIHGEIGTLTIAFFVGGTGNFFSPTIRAFRERFPNVQVSVVEMASGIQHQALQGGSIDIGFPRAVPPVLTAQLRSIPLHSEPLYAVMLRNHFLAKKRSIFIRDLAGQRFVLNDRQYSLPCSTR